MNIMTLFHRLLNLLTVSAPLFTCVIMMVLTCLYVMRTKRTSLLQEWLSSLTAPFFDVTNPLVTSQSWKTVRQHWIAVLVETIIGTCRLITTPYVLISGIVMITNISYTATRLLGAVILAPMIIRILIAVMPVKGDLYDSSVLKNSLNNRQRLLRINDITTSLITNLLYFVSLILVLLFDKAIF